MTNSAPLRGSMLYSPGVACDRDETIEEVSAGATPPLPSQPPRQKATGTRRRVAVSAPVSAPLVPFGKVCKACGEIKPLADYNKHKHTRDRLQVYCRSCHAQKERERYAKSAECRAQIKRRDQRHAVERTHIARAQHMAANAIKRGRIPRGPCELVGAECRGQIQAHHDDYSKPLEIRWLCRKHHVDADRARRALERAA